MPCDLQIRIFLQLQLDRIKATPTPHASGPKKPTLSQLDSLSKNS